MNNEISLSEKAASAPFCGSHAPRVKPTLEFYAPIIRRDDSWRELPADLRGKVHSRKGGLSDFIPFATNGVLVIGFSVRNRERQLVGHLSNLIIERENRGILLGFLKKQRSERVRSPRKEKAPHTVSVMADDLF